MTYISTHYWGIFMPSWNILYLIYNIFQRLKLYLQKLCVPSEMIVRILLQWISCQPGQEMFFVFFPSIQRQYSVVWKKVL